MDAKDLRTEITIGERSSNGSSKFAQGGAAPSKPYESISANPLAKLEAPSSRPCAVIGPDRIVPPSNADVYPKKGHYEPWHHVDNTYRQPPEYPHKITSYQSPIRNISPRQTFQENMQRIMVQPSYNSVKLNDDPNYTLDRNASKNNKNSGPHEAKYCDVPYSVNPIISDPKPNETNVTDMSSSRNYPQVWHPPGGVGIRPIRPYGAPDMYQFPEYASCASSRPMPMPRPNRTLNEDPSHVYNGTYYPEGNIRFKPYPVVKERYPQGRYEYVSNYTNPFHPPPFSSHKYDLQKPLPPHVTYPQIPIKYLENRMTDSMDGYQRPQSANYNVTYRNQIIHPTYGPMVGHNLPNKVYPYPSEVPTKSLSSNKLPYDSKLYMEYENARNKGYPMPDHVYQNEIVRPLMKNHPILPNYPNPNIQPTHAHQYYRKESLAARNYEYISHLRHLEPSMNPNALTRLTTQFSPNSIAISPSDSNTSNETLHTHGGSLEDCGYVSQSSTTSIRSFDSGVSRLMPNDFYQRYNYPYQTMVRNAPMPSKQNGTGTAITAKDSKSIDVRQFLQMWNEGDEENGSKEKEVLNSTDINSSKLSNQYGGMKNHELYVLGLVDVPSEELSKYEHIQKISKLPENIKGYNNVDLLKHFEEAIESSNISNQNHKTPTTRNYHPSMKCSLAQGTGLLSPRPISPFDVEAKISQSVIHKEVGCNFEIKPCSPEMLNAEVATAAQNILGEERVIEKVCNPINIKSPIMNTTSGSDKTCDAMNQKEHRILLKEDGNETPSCDMINTACLNNEGVNVGKANYSLQDLESNAGVCLASLPRLDNDIELNFPEVNQQFINANKDSVIIANDFTPEMEPMSNNDYNADKNKINKPVKSSSVTPTLDLDKEVTKLSKFRKIKRTAIEHTENSFVSASQSLRTDSVIIKNPENTKSLDKNSDTPPLIKETNPPTNHLMDSDTVYNSPFNNQTMDNIKSHENTNEMAIDFSLSKVENCLIDKDSKYFCAIYSTESLNMPPEKLPINQQLPKDSNPDCNLQSDSTNDIIMKIPMSDKVNDINLCGVPENIEKSDKLVFENINYNDASQSKECSENPSETLLDTANSQTNSSNVIKLSTVDHIDTTDHVLSTDKTESEMTKKHIMSTKQLEKKGIQLNSSMDINERENNDDNISSSENYNSTTSNTYKEETVLSSDVLFNNLDHHNTSSSVQWQLNKVKPYCSNKNMIDSDDTDKPIFCDVLEKSNYNTDPFVKKFSLNKELFSPRIQNLILWSEGHNDLLISQQNESKNSSLLFNSNVDISSNEKNLNNHTIQIESSNDNNSHVCNSELDVLVGDHLTSNKSESTKVKDYDSDAKVTPVENSINGFAHDDLPLESTNALEYADFNSEAAVSAEDNILKDCTRGEGHSKSTNAKYYAAPKSEVTYVNSIYDFMECENYGIQSKTSNETNTESNLSEKGNTLNNSIDNFTNNEQRSVPLNAKDYPNLMNFSEDIIVANNIKEFSNEPLRPVSTHAEHSSDENSGAKNTDVDDSFQDFTNSGLHSKFTNVNLETNLVVQEIAIENSINGMNNDGRQSELSDKYILDLNTCADDTTAETCLKDFKDNVLQTESLIVKDNAKLSSCVEYTTVDNSVKILINNEQLSDSTNNCNNSDPGAEVITVANTNSATDMINNKLQSDVTDLKLCLDSDTEAPDMDSINSTHFGKSKLYSKPSTVNSKLSITNSEPQSKLADVKYSTVSSSIVEISSVDCLNSVNVCNKSELQSETIVKDCGMSGLNVKLFVANSLTSVINSANGGLQSESTDGIKCSISGLEVDTCIVDNMNSNKDSANVDLQLIATDIGDCCISDNSFEGTSTVDKIKNSDFTNDKLQIKPTNPMGSEISTLDHNVSIVNISNIDKDSDHDKLNSKSSNINHNRISDSYEDKSYEGIKNNVKDIHNTPNTKSASYNEYLNHIAETGNMKEGICYSNNVCDSNQYDNPDYKKANTIADDSGVHSIGPDSSVYEEQATDTDNLILHNAIISFEQTSERLLDKIQISIEEPKKTMQLNTAGNIKRGLKRSLSETDLCFYNNDKSEKKYQEDIHIQNLIKKRRRGNHCLLNTHYPHLAASNMLNIHNNRRNSISSIYNEENMSFCIVIDNNCIITEENEEGEKLCYTEIPEECLTGIQVDKYEDDEESVPEIILCQEEHNEYNEPLLLEISDAKSLEESWVDDVACVETVVSDDIAEDIELSDPSSPTDIDEQDNDESDVFSGVSEHTDKVKYIYGDKMCNHDAELVETLYRTPQMDVNKTLINIESHVTDDDNEFSEETTTVIFRPESHGQKKKVKISDCHISEPNGINYNTSMDATDFVNTPIKLQESEPVIATTQGNEIHPISCEVSQHDTINWYESSVDQVISYHSHNCSVFSSPEVSSTTSEEKNASLLLKITNYQGTRTSQISDLNLAKTNSCKFTENTNYTNFISNSTEPRPLITKAAQKYIPPLKETINDLKIKLPLSKDSLLKFKQLKINKTGVRPSAVPKKDIPKKPKPKFEDVLKSLDEIQFKMHKEKRKKPKISVPKVVIKKTENGSHYASTPNKDCFNPDLTGRKWQPWVIIKKNSFIDKMALRRKTKAIYNHRKNTYVFADKFKKYKSMPSAKFVITQPKLDDSSVGKLKYTIRLKHSN